MYKEERKYDDRYQIERFAKTEREFQSFYQGELREQMDAFSAHSESLEPLKKKSRVGTIGLLGVMALNFVLPLVTSNGGGLMAVSFIVAIVLVLACILPYARAKRKLENAIKEQIIQKIVTFLNPNYTYEPKQYIPKQDFLHAELFSHRADEYRGDDLIKGYVLDSESGFKTDIAFSEVEATEVTHSTDSKGNTRTSRTTFFKGLMFVVDFNKDFGETMTQIVPNRKTLFGNMTKAGGVSTKRRLNTIDIEHPLFNEHFLVRSNDEVMSRVILQMDFIEKLLEFTTQVGVVDRGKLEDNIYITFKNGKMYLLMNTKKNHFAIGDKAIDTSLAVEFFEDINRSLELIDELNLNLHIYDKEN